MTQRATILAAILLGAALGGAPPAAAQADPAATFQRGLRAYQEGRYNDALMAFEEVYAVRPLPDVVYNIALVSRALGRYQAAIAAYERFLALPGATPEPAQLQSVRETITALHGLLARIFLRATPPTATLTLDGRPAEAQDGALVVDPGDHALEVSSPGYALERREVRVSAGGLLELEVRLRPLRAADGDAATSTGPSAWVWLGGSVAFTSAGVALGVGLNADGDAREYLRRCVDSGPEPGCAALREERQGSLDTQALAVNALWATAAVGVVVASVALLRWAFDTPRRGRTAQGLRFSPGGAVVVW